MASREELIAQAQQKWERNSLIEQAHAKWDSEQKGDDDGVLMGVARGIGKVANAVDSYTGAPVRSAIGALQDGSGLGGAAKSLVSQFGEDPSLAPTEKSIRQKAGIDLGDEKLMNKDADGALEKIFRATPIGTLTSALLTRISPNDLVEFGIGAGADLTNLVPVAGAAKRVGKLGIEAVDAGLRGTAKVIQKTGSGLATTGKKVLSGATGVDSSQINKYLQNHERLKDIVDTRSGISAIKDDLDATLEPLQSRVGASKERLGVAKERRTEELSRLTDAQREAKEQLRLAEQQRIGETSATVSKDVQRLNKDVSAGSEKAYSILDQEGIVVPVSPIKGDLTKGIKALEASAVTDEQVAVVDLLNRYRERLDKFGKEISGGEAKRLIQSLDREMGHIAPGSVGRLSKDDQVLGVLRKRFDTPLKASPAYAKQMEGVAKDTRLLISAEDMATESGAARALQAAQRTTGKDRAEILRLLGERQGADYLAAVERASLPEYKKLAGILQRHRAARKGVEMNAAKAELDAALADVAPFKTVAPNEFGKSGSEALIRNQIRPTTAGLDQAELVKNIDKRFGKNYSSQIDDLKTISAFDKEFTRGSANTNFWAIASGATGFGLGGGVVGGVGGGALGAAFGKFVIDKFGPATARVILDQAVNLKRMAPTEWIKQLKVPDSVKSSLMKDLVYQNTARGVRGGAAVTKPVRDFGSEIRNVADSDSEPNRSPAKGYDKWANAGVKKLGLPSPLADKLMQTKEGKQLLIEASDLDPNSPAMKRIKDKITKGWK